ncbi:MAG: sn-glycerol-3-phosphate ABC transporter ATP-binding protein UgpC [Gemmatimonadota bacterium]
MARVRLEKLRKIYQDGPRSRVAVHDVELDVADGEFVVLVGPSGCGKSTTLRMIAGLESISGGRLLIGDRVMNDVPPKDRDIAMVFQSYALYPHMTAFDNMAFALRLRDRPLAEITKRVEDAATLLGISELLQRKPRQMSGGERQRIALGRAIVRQPQVFLFDEPLSNLDAKLRVQMRREIARLHRQLGTTMIYVTHDQVEAMTLGDRIVVLRDGRVQQIADPGELYATPRNAFVASFIGTPPMNLIKGAIEPGTPAIFRSSDGLSLLPLPGLPVDRLTAIAGRPLILGVRPEDVHPATDGGLVVRVDLVEPLGNEILVYASLGETELIARAAPGQAPSAASSIRLQPDTARLHFFDAESGQRIEV